MVSFFLGRERPKKSSGLFLRMEKESISCRDFKFDAETFSIMHVYVYLHLI